MTQVQSEATKRSYTKFPELRKLRGQQLKAYWEKRWNRKVTPETRQKSCCRHIDFQAGCIECQKVKRAYNRKYRNNPINRQKDIIRIRKYYQKVRFDVLYHYSDGTFECACCGFNDPNAKAIGRKFLQLDHIAGQQKGRNRKESTTSLFVKLKNRGYPPGFRVLCAGCNASINSNEWICELHKWEMKVMGFGDTFPLEAFSEITIQR